jgi:hypothetical protein
MLTIVNTAVSSFVGPGAEMEPAERKAIEDPLARIMERMAPATNEMLSKWTDPILLSFAVFSWVARVYQDIQIQNRFDDEGPGGDDSPPPETPPPPDNGIEVEDISANAQEVMAIIEGSNLDVT